MSGPGHIPDYILIGQILDNPDEKAPYQNEDQMSQGSTLLAYPSSPSGPSVSNFQPPEYREDVASPITPSESASQAALRPPPKPVSRITERMLIPTKNDSLSSGFPYDRRVWDLISHDEWHLLSSDIVNASKTTFAAELAAWGTGFSAGIFSLVLVPGYYAGRSMHRKMVIKGVKERLERDGDIRNILRRWNEVTFGKRGFQVWLELPVDGEEIEMEEKETDTSKDDGAARRRKQEKIEKKIKRRFKIVIVPGDGLGRDPNSCESPLDPTDGSMAGGELNGVAELGQSEKHEGNALVEAPGKEQQDPVELPNEGVKKTPLKRKLTAPLASQERTLSECSTVQPVSAPPVELDGSTWKDPDPR